mgnify:CR=1 FL=1
MKTKLVLIVAFAFLAIPTTAQSKAHKDSLKALVKTYYDLNIKVFQADSKPVDVDLIFNLFTDDFTYVHPKYGGIYTREVLLKGYLRNQKNGRYDGDVTSIKIVNKIVGLNSVVVARKYVTKKEGVGDSKMTLFEFKKGKISKIFEYW